MKKYRVIPTDDALDQARKYLNYIAEQAQSAFPAERWWKKARKKLETLETFPHRCPLAPEDESSRHELRMLVVDRCLFIFHVEEEDQVVRVVRFRHGSQLPRPLDD